MKDEEFFIKKKTGHDTNVVICGNEGTVVLLEYYGNHWRKASRVDSFSVDLNFKE